MSRLYPTLSLLLGLIAAAAVAYAWQLRGELADALAARAKLERDAAHLPARTGEAPRKPGSGAAGPAVPRPAAQAGAPALTAPAGGPRDMAGRGAQMAALMDSPEMVRLMSLQQRANLDGRFADLFRMLNLRPADLEKFKDLLVEKQQAAMDVFAAARSQGMTGRENRDDLRELVAASEADADAAIRSTLGDSVFQQYKQYEQTLPQRAVAGQLEQRLSYSDTPLTSSQREQLVSLLAASSPAPAGSAAAPTPLFVGPGAMLQTFGGGRSPQISDQVVTASQGFLSAPQVAALQQIGQEHAAQAQLRQQFQNRMNPNAGPTATPPPATGGRSGP